MVNFWRVVNNVIVKADVIVEVIDARFPDMSRNKEIEDKIKKSGKKLVVALNKIDLCSGQIDASGDSVAISAKNRIGTSKLKRKILAAGAKKDERIVVGIVGYPNTGKSSVINAISGKSKAKTSFKSGFTRGLQHINAGPRLILLDTPGVIPFKEKDELLQTIIAAKDPSMLKTPDLIAAELIKSFKGKFEKFYGVNESADPYETLEKIGIAKNVLIKGGEPDIDSVSRRIIMEWQKGKIR
ncbi:MAG: GTPase [Nanobdellota archaeon]